MLLFTILKEGRFKYLLFDDQSAHWLRLCGRTSQCLKACYSGVFQFSDYRCRYTVHQCQNWITTVHHWEESFSGGGGGERVYVLMVRAVTGNYASCNPLLQLLPRHNQSCSGWSGAGPRIYATTVSDVSWLEEGLNGCISDFLEIFYKFLVPE